MPFGLHIGRDQRATARPLAELLRREAREPCRIARRDELHSERGLANKDRVSPPIFPQDRGSPQFFFDSHGLVSTWGLRRDRNPLRRSLHAIVGVILNQP
ncbi:hypothetical protein Y023_5668 [Burkholderia pseudomallei A79D]|nr:hypothetical protein Y023_5668 [Burkholderia pseudomallei A79D]KGX95416.1 hypothetical protein X997_5507 [Burkholderia pseudomallei A79C]